MIKIIQKLKQINSIINMLSKQNKNAEYYNVRIATENRILLKKINKQKLHIVLIAFEPFLNPKKLS